jgi:TctA family transporter
VLGYPTETTLRQSLIMGDGAMSIFFTRPIALPLMLAALALFLLPLFQIGMRILRQRMAAQGR